MEPKSTILRELLFINTVTQAVVFSAAQASISGKNVTTALFNDNVVISFSHRTKQTRIYILGMKHIIASTMTISSLRELLSIEARSYYNHLSVQGI